MANARDELELSYKNNYALLTQHFQTLLLAKRNFEKLTPEQMRGELGVATRKNIQAANESYKECINEMQAFQEKILQEEVKMGAAEERSRIRRCTIDATQKVMVELEDDVNTAHQHILHLHKAREGLLEEEAAGNKVNARHAANTIKEAYETILDPASIPELRAEKLKRVYEASADGKFSPRTKNFLWALAAALLISVAMTLALTASWALAPGGLAAAAAGFQTTPAGLIAGTMYLSTCFNLFIGGLIGCATDGGGLSNRPSVKRYDSFMSIHNGLTLWSKRLYPGENELAPARAGHRH